MDSNTEAPRNGDRATCAAPTCAHQIMFDSEHYTPGRWVHVNIVDVVLCREPGGCRPDRAGVASRSLLGANVTGTDDDRPAPLVGVVVALTDDPEWVMVGWGAGSAAPGREPVDCLRLTGNWA